MQEQRELEREVDSLCRDTRKLQLGRDLLKKVNELLKKDLGVDLRISNNQEKTLLVDALRQTYAFSKLLGQLELIRSSYFYHRARLRVSDKLAHAIMILLSSSTEKIPRTGRLLGQERLTIPKVRRRRYYSYEGEISPVLVGDAL